MTYTRHIFTIFIPIQVSIAALGDVTSVGTKLAEKRGAQLVSAKAALKEDILFYIFEFKGGESNIHHLYQVSKVSEHVKTRRAEIFTWNSHISTSL